MYQGIFGNSPVRALDNDTGTNTGYSETTNDGTLRQPTNLHVSRSQGDSRYEDTGKTTGSGGLHGFLGGVFNWLKNGDDSSDPSDKGDRSSSDDNDSLFEYEDTKEYPSNYDEYDDDDDDDDDYDSLLDGGILDDSVGDTLNMIHRSERRWRDEDDTRDILNLKYKPREKYKEIPEMVSIPTDYSQELEELITRIETSNEMLLRMVDNFDAATFKNDYKNVKAENAQLSKKYYRLRKEFKDELLQTQKVHRSYCDLVRKYKKLTLEKNAKQGLEEKCKLQKVRISELERQDRENKQEIKRQRERNNKLLAKSVENTRTTQDSLLFYQKQYEEMKKNYLRKVHQEQQLRASLEHIDKDPSPVRPATAPESETPTPTMHIRKQSDDSTNSLESLRKRFASKRFEDIVKDDTTKISRPTIEL